MMRKEKKRGRKGVGGTLGKNEGRPLKIVGSAKLDRSGI